jgi:hypothetical protein
MRLCAVFGAEVMVGKFRVKLESTCDDRDGVRLILEWLEGRG